MTNQQIAAMLRELAELLLQKKESWFKIMAYRKVADEIDAINTPLSELITHNRLREILGVGEAIEKKIIEMLTTGRLQVLEKVRAELAEGKVGKTGK